MPLTETFISLACMKFLRISLALLFCVLFFNNWAKISVAGLINVYHSLVPNRHVGYFFKSQLLRFFKLINCLMF